MNRFGGKKKFSFGHAELGLPVDNQVYEAIDSRDGASCAELVSFKHPHVANPRLQMASPEEKCQQVLEPPYDEMFAAHLR